MEGMENSGNDIQLVTNQEGKFAGYRECSGENKKGKKTINKFSQKKKVDMPPKVKKLFNLGE